MEPTFPHPICAEELAIDTVWQMQLIIRQLGGVVTRINIQNPKRFNDFFASNPTGVFNNSSTCLPAEVNATRHPHLSAQAAALDVNIVNLVQDNLWTVVPVVETSWSVSGGLPSDDAGADDSNSTTSGQAFVKQAKSLTMLVVVQSAFLAPSKSQKVWSSVVSAAPTPLKPLLELPHARHVLLASRHQGAKLLTMMKLLTVAARLVKL
eukprot:gene7681-7882_t